VDDWRDTRVTRQFKQAIQTLKEIVMFNTTSNRKSRSSSTLPGTFEALESRRLYSADASIVMTGGLLSVSAPGSAISLNVNISSEGKEETRTLAVIVTDPEKGTSEEVFDLDSISIVDINAGSASFNSDLGEKTVNLADGVSAVFNSSQHLGALSVGWDASLDVAVNSKKPVTVSAGSLDMAPTATLLRNSLPAATFADGAEVKITYVADVNHDGSVDHTDEDIIVAAYNGTGEVTGSADMNGDGIVDDYEISILGGEFGM